MKVLKSIRGKAAFCIAAVMCCFAFMGCGEKDGMYVRDEAGKIYRLECRIGDCYFLNEVKLPEKWAK